MWKYSARNLCKPGIALGDSGILEVHNPQGVHFLKPHMPENDFYAYIDKLPHILSHMDQRANRYKKKILGEIYG